MHHGLRVVFFVCLLCTILATILLMAPTVYHRVRWQQGNKTEVIRAAHRMFLIGMAFLALAMTTAVCIVADVLLGVAWAIVATTTSAAVIGLTWYALPLRSRSHPGSTE